MSSDPSNPNLTDGAATVTPDEPAVEFNDVKTENLSTGDAFETDQTIIGLTSSIDEFVHVGAEQFSEVYEEPLGDKYVLQVKCNINKLLDAAGVRAPENEGKVGDTDSKIDMSTVAMFEYLLKYAAADSTDRAWGTIETDGDYNKPWSALKSVAATPKELDAQTRLFLGQFFDANKELNALAAESSNSDPRALVLLDIEKIRVELANLKNDAAGSATIKPGVTGALNTYGGADNAYAPVNRKCFATNLLSVRQIAQVLESFAQFGAYKPTSRVKAFADADNGEYYFKYKLHAGDSIIGETTVYDADAADDSEQHSQCIKVQLIQSDEGKWIADDSKQPATFVDPTTGITEEPTATNPNDTAPVDANGNVVHSGSDPNTVNPPPVPQ